jgi:hypothetical protein
MSSLTQQWEEESNIIASGLFSPATAKRLKDTCESVLQQWRQKCPLSGIAGGDKPDGTSIRHLIHPGY